MLDELYDRMFDAYGPQHWWPGDSPIEIVVGAILTQNTNWTNVELAIQNLREAKLLNLHALHEVDSIRLADLLRPAGYYRLKTKRLKNLLSHVVNRHGDLATMFLLDLPALREELLSVNGVGPETADAIILYAAEKPSFVVDAYSARIMKRHGWIDQEANYDQLKDFFESRLSPDTQHFNEFHALIVQVGKHHCKPKARCEGCPLQPMLPDTGIIEGT